jgi:hypothetical protein
VWESRTTPVPMKTLFVSNIIGKKSPGPLTNVPLSWMRRGPAGTAERTFLRRLSERMPEPSKAGFTFFCVNRLKQSSNGLGDSLFVLRRSRMNHFFCCVAVRDFRPIAVHFESGPKDQRFFSTGQTLVQNKYARRVEFRGVDVFRKAKVESVGPPL